MKEVLHGGRRAHRRATAPSPSAEPAAGVPARPFPARRWSRPTAWPPARACSSPTPSTRPSPTWRPSCRAPRSATPAGGSSSRSGSTAPSCRCCACATASGPSPLAPAQDFKRLGDGDAGPNTGGMGAYSPVPFAGPDVVAEVLERAVQPTLAALQARGHRLPGRAVRRPHAHRRTGRRCSSTTSASATPRRRSSCPATPATWPRCWPRPPPGELRQRAAVRRPGRGHRRPAPPRATRCDPRTGDVIDGLDDGRRARRTSPSSGPASTATPTAGGSPPAAGC